MSAQLYGDEYFADRLPGRDPKREQEYDREARLISRWCSAGRVLDVGAGTGLFLERFPRDRWQKWAVEIAPLARKMLAENGVILTELEGLKEKFDLIIWRGVYQHLPEPRQRLSACLDRLKPGGLFALLATPNRNSLSMRLFADMPMLDAARNTELPTAPEICTLLKHGGCRVVWKAFPYLRSPYAHPLRDHLHFLQRLCGRPVRFPFWGNMMEILALRS